MIKNHIFLSIAATTVLAFAQGCSSAQEVEVTGEATAAATVTGPISIEFFEVASAEDAAEADADESLSIKKIELAAPGPFKETVEVEGDSIRIFALADSDKNGACTEGEAWAEAQATVKEDGTLAAVTLALAVVACPTVAAPK